MPPPTGNSMPAPPAGSNTSLNNTSSQQITSPSKSVTIREDQNKTHQHVNSGDSDNDSLSGSQTLNSTTARMKRLGYEEEDVPPPPEPIVYKIVKVFHLNKWTRRFAIIIFLTSVLSTFVPQFIWYAAKSHTFGLFQECKGMACLPANFTVLQVHPACKAACNDIDTFKSRFQAASGMLWIAVICSAFLGMVQYLHYGRNYIVPLNGILIPTIVVSIIGLAVLIAGVSIVGTTLSIGYEGSSCDFAEGCLVYGSSSYIAVFGIILFFFGGLFGIIAGLFHRRRLGLKFDFFESALKHLPMEEIKLGTSMVAAAENEDDNNNDQQKMIEGEELTDLAAQPTAAFNNNNNNNNSHSHNPDDNQEDHDDGLKRRGTKEYSEEEKEQLRQVAAASALVAQESNFYATTKDKDLGDDTDSDDSDADELSDGDEDEEDKEKRAERRRKRQEAKDKREAEKAGSNSNDLNQSAGAVTQAVADLKIGVRSARGWQRVFNQMSIFCAVVAGAFIMGAVLSPKWVSISPNAFSSALDRFSIGLVAQCKDNSCSLVDNNGLLINNTCGNTEPELRARLGLSAIFYLASSIFAVPLYFTSTKTCASCLSIKARKVFTVLTALMSFFAVVLSMHTFDNWINCDIPWCEAFLSTNSEGACEYGFTFGSAIVAVGLSTVLLTMNIIQVTCRPCGYEEKNKNGDLEGISTADGGKYAYTNETSQSSPVLPNAAPSGFGNDDDDDDENSAPPPQVAETPMESTVVG